MLFGAAVGYGYEWGCTTLTKNELKKKLHRYRDLTAERAQILDELERVETIMAAPRGSNMDGMPRGAGSGDPVSGLVAQHVALVDRYQDKLAELAAAQLEIENIIDGLEPVERKLMRHRYIDGMEWETVCVVMCYSWRQTHRIHARVLDKLSDPEPATE